MTYQYYIKKLNFGDLDSGFVQNSDLKTCMTELYRLVRISDQSGGVLPSYTGRYQKIYTDSVLTLADSIDDFDELRVALRPYYVHWLSDYVLLLKYLQSMGYSFKTMDEFKPENASQKIVFLRFDIHCKDLAGLYGYLDINTAFSIPSNVYIFWDYSSAERSYAKHFRNLDKFRIKSGVKLGLHTSPVDSFLIWNQFEGVERDQIQWLNSEGGTKFLEALADSPEAGLDLIGDATEHFLKLAYDFRETFSDTVGIAAHGGGLGYVLRERFGANPFQLNAAMRPMDRVSNEISARFFLKSAPISKTGLEYETDRMPYDYGFFHISDSRNLDSYLAKFDKAFSQGAAIELLCHPATLNHQRGHHGLFDAICRRVAISPNELANPKVFFPSKKSQTIVKLFQDLNVELPNGSKFVLHPERKAGCFTASTGEEGQPPKWSVKSPSVELEMASGQCYRFSLDVRVFDREFFLKIWLLFKDPNGNDIGQLIRDVLHHDKPKELEFILKSPACALEILFEFGGQGEIEIGTSAVIQLIEFPYVAHSNEEFLTSAQPPLPKPIE